LSEELSRRGIDNIIAIDERTLRMICEDPGHLVKIMEHKLHQRIELADTYDKGFSNFRFVRSSELVYVAYKKNLIEIKGKKVLEALLYATKYKGAAISFDEINVLKKL